MMNDFLICEKELALFCSLVGFGRAKRLCAACTPAERITKFRSEYSQKSNCTATVPISTFMCLWAIYTVYSHDRSAYSVEGKYVDRSWEYINRSQTHECGNWDWGRAFPAKEYRNGIFVAVHVFLGSLTRSQLCCSIYSLYNCLPPTFMINRENPWKIPFWEKIHRLIKQRYSQRLTESIRHLLC